MSVTKEQLNAGLAMVKAVADTVKELGTVPAGTVYAAVMSRGVSLEGFEKIVGILERGGLVRKSGSSLVWCA